MGIWSGIQTIFSNNGVVEHVSSGIDKAIYTEEEKSDAYQNILKLYEPFKVAQRLISVGLFLILTLSLLLSAVVRIIGSMYCEPSLLADGTMYMWWVNDSTWLLDQSIALFGEPFLYVTVFYFGGGAFEGIAQRMSSRRDTLRNGKSTQSQS